MLYIYNSTQNRHLLLQQFLHCMNDADCSIVACYGKTICHLYYLHFLSTSYRESAVLFVHSFFAVTWQNDELPCLDIFLCQDAMQWENICHFCKHILARLKDMRVGSHELISSYDCTIAGKITVEKKMRYHRRLVPLSLFFSNKT